MTKKRKTEVVLNVDLQGALAKFPFIENGNITLLERNDKGHLYSLCDGTDGKPFWCFWDRHPIEGNIFRCPIRKVYRGNEKTYTSNINGNTYTISDHLNTETFYYETDGHFCSPECCMAYVADEETHNPLYSQSKQLIATALGELPRAAPHWRTLAVYGGALTIQEFRKSFPTREYVLEKSCSGVYPFVYKYKEVYHL